MRVYGITGGAGSGKTEVAERFRAAGIPVLSADEIGHELIARDGVAEEAVIEAFGRGILRGDAIDRGKLGELVFSDPEALGRLNAIVHPLIRRELHRRTGALATEGNALAVIDAALISEDGEPEACLDGLIVVTCPRTVRVERLVAARGLRVPEVEQRLDAQTPPEQKVALADWVIDNKGSLEELHAHADAVVSEVMSDAV